MSRTGFRFVSQRIEEEKSVKHIGTASININVLAFPHSKSLNQENVERLKRLFRIERGCRPDELPNRIPAIIEEHQLSQFLNASGLSRERLINDLPGDHAKLEFPPGFRLECLRGRHRVEAARQVLTYTDKRWIVDMYPAGISKELKHALIDEYTNEKKIDDGEFYYKIREFQGVFGVKNPYFESRWWARLATTSKSTNKKERLEQLLNHAQFAPAFDAFRHIPALYGGMRLSVINKMICMKCHDLLLFYLDEIRKFYYYVFGNDESAMKRLTKADIEALHLTAPGACQAEAQVLYGRIKAGELLGAFDDRERDLIWTNFCSATIDYMVPSLFAFFENLKYLKGPADCMKRIVRPRRGETIFSALENAFMDSKLPPGRCPVQISRTTFKFVHVDDANRLDLLYRQLWLMAIREYRDMPHESKKKLAGPREGEADEMTLFEFASLADKFGFRTQEIQSLVKRDPDREMIRRFLRTIRKPDQYSYKNLESCIAQVMKVISESNEVQEEEEIIDLEVDEDQKPPNRCGVPNDTDQLRDKSSMFLNRLHRPIEKQDVSLTSFFIQRSCYFYFFGKEVHADLNNVEDLLEETEFHPLHRAQAQREPGDATFHLGPDQLDEHQQRQRQQHQTVIDELESQEKQYHARLEIARQEVQKMEETLQSLMAKEKEQGGRLDNLERVLHDRKNSLERIENDTEDVEARIQQLRQEEADYQTQVNELKTQGSQERQKIQQLQGLEGILEEKSRIHRLTIGKHNDIAKAEQEWQSKLQKLLEEERRIHQVIQGLKADEEEWRNKVMELQREEKQRDHVTEALKVSEKEWRGKVTLLENEKKVREQAIEGLKASEEDLKGKVMLLQAEEQEREQRVKGLEVSEHEKQLSVERLGKEIESQISAFGEAETRVERLATDENGLQLRIGNLVADEERLLNSVRELEKRRLEQQKQVNDRQQVERLLQEIPLEDTSQETAGQLSSSNSGKVPIRFKQRGWVSAYELLVDPSEPTEFQRMIAKYLRKGIGIFDHQLRVLTPRNCFERVTSDKTNTIYLLPNWEVETIHQLPTATIGHNRDPLAPNSEEKVIFGQANEGGQIHKRYKKA